MDATSLIDLYDSDLDKIHRVQIALNRWAEDRGWRVELDSYRRQVIERFNDVGYDVDVIVTREEDRPDKDETAYNEFTVQINSRIERKEFDFDQQVHEQTHDLLGIGESGFIKTPVGAENVEKHKHSSSCGH
jgi:hypothetical protein